MDHEHRQDWAGWGEGGKGRGKGDCAGVALGGEGGAPFLHLPANAHGAGNKVATACVAPPFQPRLH